MKIRSAVLELLHEERRMDGETDMIKLIGEFLQNFVENDPKRTGKITSWGVRFEVFTAVNIWIVVFWVMKVEAIISSEKLVTTHKTTRRHMPEEQKSA
jgi:hypothetical protein